MGEVEAMTTTMSALACQCLNFSIHPQKMSFHRCDPKHLGLTPVEEADPFFGASVAEIKLGLGGITTKHQFLVTGRTMGEWTVYSCLGCRNDVYAEADGRLLVSSTLEHDKKKIESLQQSQGYSACYRIVLPSENSTLAEASAPGVELQVRNPKVDGTVKAVHEQMSRFLQQEQEIMEERIRAFKEEQHKKFEAMCTRAARDYEVMAALVKRLARQGIPDTMAEAPTEETSTLLPANGLSTFKSRVSNNQKDVSKIQESQEKTTELYCNIKNMAVKRQSAALTRRTRAGSYQSYLLSESVDASQIFHLDGFDEDDDSGPFPPASSEDEGDTDDSSLNDEPRVGRERTRSEPQCAFSLPVNMPAWRQSQAPDDFDEEEEERRALHATDPERIGQDIQALARSVHDGTEMFGDLPRPRLNTSDLKSRPV